ncbi:BlaI/MecI/CopY family transcriptional regulator [Salinibacterium sp. SYSU T00001]|uniref:BlaI/MecI/CopY family transcriptional regulator n=1 Tax=Homoserinimonas sedimenticola TaxID=2986805 RepID=UPI0022364283|nr:BlaI/MecI/CopY family transcriptional regulator [Salinibacterium sedimenticola]MCW4384386.1 BlaI/MecI/CopY family transcriptional regulator [Salinibacterium sedimenticola]
MATLGELERVVMDVLWDADGDLSSNEIRDRLQANGGDRNLAATTVLTVLSRLEQKDFVRRDRAQRPHLYRAVMSREAHMAELMHEVLGSAPDRKAVLARFVGQVQPSDVAALRALLDGAGDRTR